MPIKLEGGVPDDHVIECIVSLVSLGGSVPAGSLPFICFADLSILASKTKLTYRSGNQMYCRRSLCFFNRKCRCWHEDGPAVGVLGPAVRQTAVIRAVSSMSTLAVANENRFKVGGWLLLADYGELARRNTVISWSCVIALALVVSIWLPMSTLSFEQASVAKAASSVMYGAAAFAFYLAVSHRLRNDKDRVAAYLSAGLERFALLFRGCLLIAAIGSVGLIFTYLATSSAPPLKDAFLAELDSHLGFHWPSFLSAINDRPFLADLLVKAYASTAALTQGVVIWLSIRGRGERLSEFLALLCLSSLGLAVGMLLAPAAGAFVYFEPARELFDNYTDRDMWPFLDAFNALRDGSLTEIDISSVQGVVSFPSFHTMLGIITTYALRDTRVLLIPAAIINGLMIVATLPVGGHYLLDTLVGAAISIAACYALRHKFGHRASPRQSIAVFAANGISLAAKPTVNLSVMHLLSRLKSGAPEYVFVMIAACLVAYIAMENLRGHF